MEEVIQVVIFLVITSLFVIRKSKEVNKNRPGQPVNNSEPEEDFLDSEEIEEMMGKLEKEMQDFEFPASFDNPFKPKTQVSPAEQQEVKTKGKDKKEFYQPIDNPGDFQERMFQSPLEPTYTAQPREPKKPHRKHSNATPVHTDETRQKSSPKAKEPMVRIKTRSEARKAFIYSEIFNRKYE